MSDTPLTAGELTELTAGLKPAGPESLVDLNQEAQEIFQELPPRLAEPLPQCPWRSA